MGLPLPVWRLLLSPVASSRSRRDPKMAKKKLKKAKKLSGSKTTLGQFAKVAY